MPYKVSPTPSIENEGGIVIHINNFFIKRNSTLRFGDVVRLKHIDGLPKRAACRKLNISVSTWDKWCKLIDQEGLDG